MRQKKPHILWTLFRLWRVWRRCPEQRLGQLIDNSMHLLGCRSNLFNVHDEDLLLIIESFERRTRI